MNRPRPPLVASLIAAGVFLGAIALSTLSSACVAPQSGPASSPATGPTSEDPAGSNGVGTTTTNNPTTGDAMLGGSGGVANPGGTPTEDGCSREIAIRCRAPFTDGCSVPHPTDASRKLTSEHRCVSSEPTSTSCEAEIALECGDGARDACLLDPPAGDVHFCVAI